MGSMKIMIVTVAVLLALLVILVVPSRRFTWDKEDVAITGEGLFRTVRGIEGKSPDGRKQYIKERLSEMAAPFTTMPFDTIITSERGNDTLHGENIVVRLGSGKRKIVVGAHCDAVPGSPGANDNGGGVAVVLDLIRLLKSGEFRHTVDFCFFDLEEKGLIGSAVYVRRSDPEPAHLAMINLDVEGTGDVVYAGPVGGGDDDMLMKYIRLAHDKTMYNYHENEAYPGSDHLSFAAAKLENISISIVPKGDAEKLAKWVASGEGRIDNPDDVPGVLKVMHSPEDKSKYVSPEALFMSYNFTKTALLALDEGEE
jgi:hypothetical protein